MSEIIKNVNAENLKTFASLVRNTINSMNVSDTSTSGVIQNVNQNAGIVSTVRTMHPKVRSICDDTGNLRLSIDTQNTNITSQTIGGAFITVGETQAKLTKGNYSIQVQDDSSKKGVELSTSTSKLHMQDNDNSDLETVIFETQLPNDQRKTKFLLRPTASSMWECQNNGGYDYGCVDLTSNTVFIGASCNDDTADIMIDGRDQSISISGENINLSSSTVTVDNNLSVIADLTVEGSAEFQDNVNVLSQLAVGGVIKTLFNETSYATSWANAVNSPIICTDKTHTSTTTEMVITHLDRVTQANINNGKPCTFITGYYQDSSSSYYGTWYYNGSTAKQGGAIKQTGTTTSYVIDPALVCNSTCEASSFTARSDARLKENIVPFKSQKSILDLPVYKFDFIDGPKNQIGCIAQELQEICPEIVIENSDGYLTINESKLVYLLMEEVRNLKKQLESK